MASCSLRPHFFQRKKVHHYWREGPLWNASAVFYHFQPVCFGLLFLWRIGAAPIVQQRPKKFRREESSLARGFFTATLVAADPSQCALLFSICRLLFEVVLRNPIVSSVR